MVDIVHRVGIRAPVSRVYAALTTLDGLAGWWTQDTTGCADLDGQITFRFHDPAGREMGAFVMGVAALVPDQLVHWQVQQGPAEWLGTEVAFRLSEQDGQTLVLFSHRGWREEVAFTAHCSMKWATFLLSLRALVETGQGRPAPHDLKIDNWN